MNPDTIRIYSKIKVNQFKRQRHVRTYCIRTCKPKSERFKKQTSEVVKIKGCINYTTIWQARDATLTPVPHSVIYLYMFL